MSDTETKTVEPKKVRLKSGVTVDILATAHQGQLSSVILKKDSGWGIFVIGGVSCVGVLHEIQVGAAYSLVGKYEENKKYNSWDFKVSSYTVDINTSNGIRELLINECPGLGPSLVNRLVTNFQQSTLQVLEREPQKVAEFLGTTLEQATKFSQWAKGQSANLDMKQRLYKIGITQGKVKKIIESYGANAEAKIKKDCFGLTGIHGFGFKTVAAIADLIGVPKDDPGRIKAALKYSLEELQNEGHTCLHANDVLRAAHQLTAVHQNKISPLLEEMITNQELIKETEDWGEYSKKRGIKL